MVAPQLSRMNWQQRSGQIYANLMEPGLRSIRAIAAATGIAKSSVHRLVQAIERRHQYPESPLWEHPSGYHTDWSGQWCMCSESRGIGNETLSEFFHILHLEGRIGVSQCPAGYERKSSSRLNYRDEQQAQLQQSRRVLKSVGQMRPFEQMVLVLLDLPSGYIFVESQATARDYQTWRGVQQALGSMSSIS